MAFRYLKAIFAVPRTTKQSTRTYKPKKGAKEGAKPKGQPKERGQNYISDMMTRWIYRLN